MPFILNVVKEVLKNPVQLPGIIQTLNRTSDPQ